MYLQGVLIVQITKFSTKFLLPIFHFIFTLWYAKFFYDQHLELLRDK